MSEPLRPSGRGGGFRGKLAGGAAVATPARGAPAEVPGEDESPGEHRADRRTNLRCSRHGLAPGSKALKSTGVRDFRTVAALRTDLLREAAGPTASRHRSSAWAFGSRERTLERQEGSAVPRGAAAPGEGKALKGLELHERSGTKQGREPVEEKAVMRA